jgi:hypothetical protein
LPNTRILIHTLGVLRVLPKSQGADIARAVRAIVTDEIPFNSDIPPPDATSSTTTAETICRQANVGNLANEIRGSQPNSDSAQSADNIEKAS